MFHRPKVKFRSAGQGVWASWLLTKAKIEVVLDQQSLMLPGKKSLDKTFFNDPPKPVRKTFDPDTRIIAFLDEPTEFLDPKSVRIFCAEVAELIERYKGRLQLFICSHNETLATSFAGLADFLDCYQQPATVLPEFRV